ncbi:hypothetical protein FRC08_005756 [Ceratobasidium sp. 394]|nr:hypothetical protein FRC08_005756 [Ceratobasidium sp. 394]
MSTPSAHRQASKAQERAAEVVKAQLDTLETKQRTDYEELAERICHSEMDIKGLRDANERLLKDDEDYQHQHQLLRAQVNYKAGRLDVAAADLETLAPGLTIKTFDEEPIESGPNPDGGASGPVAVGPMALELDVQSEAAAVRSRQARDAHKMKEAVRSVLFSLYRVNNFNNIADKHYPHVPVDLEEWPHSLKHDGTQGNHMRLDFELDFDSPTNWPQIQRWSAAIRDQGEIRVAGVQPYLDSISESDLLDRIEKTFSWEKWTYQDAMKNVPIPTKN